MSLKILRREKPTSKFTITIQGTRTEWTFRRVTALEEAQIQCDTRELETRLLEKERLFLANLGLLKRAEAEALKLEAGEEDYMPDEAGARTLHELMDIQISEKPITPDMLRPVYSWLAELLTGIAEFDENNVAERTSTFSDDERDQLVQLLSHDHAHQLLKRVVESSHLSDEARGK